MNDNEKTHSQLIAELEEMRAREKRTSEYLKRRNLESLGILAGGIAHDFNNLLTTLMGNISMARMVLHDGEKLNRVLERAQDTSLTGVELTQKLLTFSDGGNPVIEKKSLWAIVEDTIDANFRKSCKNIKKIFPPGLKQVLCDKTQMKQVIYNLILNALQASVADQSITISAENIEISPCNDCFLSAGQYVSLTITDKGTGIPIENLDKIFDPYFSTRNDLTQHGLGLGLSICRSIIHKHNGHIKVQSHVGEGTTVNILIPATD